MFNVHGCSDQGDLKILRTQLDCSWRFDDNRLDRKGQVRLGIKDAGIQGQVETRIPLVAELTLLWVVLLVVVL